MSVVHIVDIAHETTIYDESMKSAGLFTELSAGLECCSGRDGKHETSRHGRWRYSLVSCYSKLHGYVIAELDVKTKSGALDTATFAECEVGTEA